MEFHFLLTRPASAGGARQWHRAGLHAAQHFSSLPSDEAETWKGRGAERKQRKTSSRPRSAWVLLRWESNRPRAADPRAVRRGAELAGITDEIGRRSIAPTFLQPATQPAGGLLEFFSKRLRRDGLLLAEKSLCEWRQTGQGPAQDDPTSCGSFSKNSSPQAYNVSA